MLSALEFPNLDLTDVHDRNKRENFVRFILRIIIIINDNNSAN